MSRIGLRRERIGGDPAHISHDIALKGFGYKIKHDVHHKFDKSLDDSPAVRQIVFRRSHRRLGHWDRMACFRIFDKQLLLEFVVMSILLQLANAAPCCVYVSGKVGLERGAMELSRRG